MATLARAGRRSLANAESSGRVIETRAVSTKSRNSTVSASRASSMDLSCSFSTRGVVIMLIFAKSAPIPRLAPVMN
jgi:hypothetical protein